MKTKPTNFDNLVNERLEQLLETATITERGCLIIPQKQISVCGERLYVRREIYSRYFQSDLEHHQVRSSCGEDSCCSVLHLYRV